MREIGQRNLIDSDKRGQAVDQNERCYPERSSRRVWQDHLARYNFASRFAGNKIVLDIACGEGFGSDIIKRGGARSVYGADNDGRIIKAAERKYRGINFLRADATKTPFAPAYFDLVISFETWHHLDNHAGFIAEMHRILKPGGRLIISVPNEKIIYLNPLRRKFLTKYYRIDFNVEKIKKYLENYFMIEGWYGQRFVKGAYTGNIMKFLLFVGGHVSKRIGERVNSAFKLADGPKVKALAHDNARYLIVVAKKI